MNVEHEIKQIKKRNERVELDKRWETSWTRRIAILLLTFVVVLIFNFLVSQQVTIVLSSLVPVIAFFLSTLSLGLVRKVWENKSGRKETK
jgi:membrane protein YdbS with pleckstrin-like domain